MNEINVSLTETDGALLRSLARQLGKTDGEVVGEALVVLRDRLGSGSEARAAILRRAAGMWKDREDLPTLDELRGESNRTPVVNEQMPETQTEFPPLSDAEGVIPRFPPWPIDRETGRLLPVSDEERAARRAATLRAIKAIALITDETDTEEGWDEVFRNIDAGRPHRKLFEGMY